MTFVDPKGSIRKRLLSLAPFRFKNSLLTCLSFKPRGGRHGRLLVVVGRACTTPFTSRPKLGSCRGSEAESARVHSFAPLGNFGGACTNTPGYLHTQAHTDMCAHTHISTHIKQISEKRQRAKHLPWSTCDEVGPAVCTAGACAAKLPPWAAIRQPRAQQGRGRTLRTLKEPHTFKTPPPPALGKRTGPWSSSLVFGLSLFVVPSCPDRRARVAQPEARSAVLPHAAPCSDGQRSCPTPGNTE